MQEILEQVGRERYRPSGRVALTRFFPLVLCTTILALGLAFLMDWLFTRGWYLIVIVPLFAAFFMVVNIWLAVRWGKCRAPGLAAFFGLVMGILLYGGQYYFGMLGLIGYDNWTRVDLLPRYISMRIHSDTTHDMDMPDQKNSPSVFMNGFAFVLESGAVLLLCTLGGYRAAQQAYCETCGAWKRRATAVFAPGNQKNIYEWLNNGEIANLRTLPLYSPIGKKRIATVVQAERCAAGAQTCVTYLSAKNMSASTGGGIHNAVQLTGVPHLQISEPEWVMIQPLFPKLAGNLTVEGAPAQFTPATAGPSAMPAINRGALIEVQPIPAADAHKVLTKAGIAMGNLAALSVLVVFIGSIVGMAAPMIMVFNAVSNSHHVNPIIAALAVLVSLAFFVLFCLSIYMALKNPGVVGNRYYWFRSRSSIASRLNKWVDPQRPAGSETYFNGIVPRERWGKLAMEMATDIGFTEIDPRRREIRFEGDVQRFRIPISAITNCQMVCYFSTAGSNQIEYWLVVVQGSTAGGPWEAPIAPRVIKCSPAPAASEFLLSNFTMRLRR